MNILKEIKPNEQEVSKLKDICKELIGNLSKNVNADIIIGGSIAKDTWLKSQHDIDLFVVFKEDKNISIQLESSIKKTFKKYITIHGSRDYFQINYKNYTFELVPVLKIKNPSEAKNIMDISPLHAKWVKKNINNLNDEVRLAKYFCKINNLYGAESYIKGFSGYSLEILIIYYKGFLNLLKHASEWKDLKIIDIEKYNSFKTLNKSKLSPLIIIDPVQQDRNVSAALTKENFNKFIAISKKYIKNPSEKFFKQKDFKKSKDTILLYITPLNERKDIALTKVLKIFNFIKSKLVSEGFNIKDSDIIFNETPLIYLQYKNKTIPNYKIHLGPPINKKENVLSFKNKWKKYKIYKEKNHIYIKLKVKYNSIKPYLNSLLKDEFIKQRVKNIKTKYL